MSGRPTRSSSRTRSMSRTRSSAGAAAASPRPSVSKSPKRSVSRGRSVARKPSSAAAESPAEDVPTPTVAAAPSPAPVAASAPADRFVFDFAAAPPLPAATTPSASATAGAVNGEKASARSAPSAGAGDGDNTRVLGALFVAVISLLAVLRFNMPEIKEADRAKVRFPTTLTELQDLSELLQSYRKDHATAVLAAFCGLYIFLQMFAIPGAIFLSVLAGPLFGVTGGLVLVSIVATSGATMCYALSYSLGRGLVRRCVPAMLERFRQSLDAHRHNLIWYLLFLRVSPLLPNWFINISSPILEVPLSTFVTATFFGLIPANYIHVTTGLTLSELEDISELTRNYKKLAFLFFLAFLMLIPTLFRKRFEAWEKAMAAGPAAAPAAASTAPAAESQPSTPLNGHSAVPATPPAKVLGDSRTPNKLLLS